MNINNRVGAVLNLYPEMIINIDSSQITGFDQNQGVSFHLGNEGKTLLVDTNNNDIDAFLGLKEILGKWQSNTKRADDKGVIEQIYAIYPSMRIRIQKDIVVGLVENYAGNTSFSITEEESKLTDTSYGEEDELIHLNTIIKRWHKDLYPSKQYQKSNNRERKNA